MLGTNVKARCNLTGIGPKFLRDMPHLHYSVFLCRGKISDTHIHVQNNPEVRGLHESMDISEALLVTYHKIALELYSPCAVLFFFKTYFIYLKGRMGLDEREG